MFKNHSYPPVSIGAIVEENSKVRALENKLLERKEREVGVLAQSNCGLVSNRSLSNDGLLYQTNCNRIFFNAV